MRRSRGRGAPADESIRRSSNRLALQTGALLVVLLAAIAAAVFIIVGASQAASVGRLLDDAARHVDSIADAPAGVWLAIDSGGTVSVSPGMPAGLPDRSTMQQVARSGQVVQSSLTLGSVTYTVRTERDPGRVVQAVASTKDKQAELGRLAVAFVVTGVGAVLLVSLLSAWLSRRVMRPLSDALAVQKRFVADASHELRTPITILSTRAQLLKRELARLPDESPALEDVDALVKDARALTEILEDLLAAADPREAQELQPLDVVRIADDVCSGLAERARDNGVTVSRSGVERAVVAGSAGALRRVFVALIDNALEFARSRIVVDLRVHAGMVEIEVVDDGPGFPPHLGERAFERFARARPAASGAGHAEPARHYGLGLSLVAEIVARHGGTVAVLEPGPGTDTRTGADPGTGAVIRLRLPEAAPPPR